MTQKTFSHQYSNGLTLVAEEMDWLESAAFALFVPAGCAYEPAGQLGLGNLTCEMAQRGAGKRDSRAFLSELENLGAETSASVSIAHTTFGGSMPAESLPAVLELYGDLILRPHLPEDQLEDARLSVLQEVRAVEDDLAQKLMLTLRARHYADPWGRSPQGTEATIEGLKMSDVRRWQQGYAPDGAILTVAGKIDFPQLVDHVDKVFGQW